MKINKYLQRTIIQKVIIVMMKQINPKVEAPLHMDSNKKGKQNKNENPSFQLCLDSAF